MYRSPGGGNEVFERFTDRARRVVVFAQEEAQLDEEINRSVMGETTRTEPASVREDVSVSLDEVSGDAPRCPRCYADLTGGLRAGTVTVNRREENGGISSMTLAWCPTCGTVIGPVP